jgi:ABC-type transporter Mla subunit MlaD
MEAMRLSQQQELAQTNKRMNEFIDSVNQKLGQQMQSVSDALQQTQLFLDQVTHTHKKCFDGTPELM